VVQEQLVVTMETVLVTTVGLVDQLVERLMQVLFLVERVDHLLEMEQQAARALEVLVVAVEQHK
jgi:hypothetical protein